MKYILFFVFFFFTGCMYATKQPIEGNPIGDSSRTSVDWVGVYEGIIPCADCEGIRTVVVLTEEGFYKISQEYLGKSSKKFENHGPFMWDTQGSQLLLRGVKGGDIWLRIGENKVDILDKEKNLILSLSEKYVLQKKSIKPIVKIEDIEEHYLTVIEIMGKKQEETEHRPYLFLNKNEKRLHGFAGCNRMMGMYEVNSNRIKFSNMVSTKMMCLEIQTEDSLFDMMQKTEMYRIENGIVTLFDNTQSALGRLKIVTFE